MATRLVEKAPSASANIFTPEVLKMHREVVTMKRELDEANGRYRTARKRLDKAGIDMKAYALLEQLAQLEEDEAAARLRTVIKLGEFLRMPVGSQRDLFDGDVTPMIPKKAIDEHDEWQAEEDGIAVGKAGGDRGEDNPHAPGDRLHVAWDRGYMKGQSIIAAQMAQEDDKPARTSRRRREPGEVRAAG